MSPGVRRGKKMDAQVVNAFLSSAAMVIKAAAFIEITMGAPYARYDKRIRYPVDCIRVILGVTGASVSGQVIISVSNGGAAEIISGMMCMPVTHIGDLEISALSELGNMILGNASTGMAAGGIITDITTPIVERGETEISPCGAQVLTIPYLRNGEPFLSIDLMLKDRRG